MSCMRIQGSTRGWVRYQTFLQNTHVCKYMHRDIHARGRTCIHACTQERTTQCIIFRTVLFFLFILAVYLHAKKNLNQNKTKPQNIQASIQYCEEENSNYLQIIENLLKGHSYRDKGLLARNRQISGAASIPRNTIIRSSARQPLQQTVLRKLPLHVFKTERRL